MIHESRIFNSFRRASPFQSQRTSFLEKESGISLKKTSQMALLTKASPPISSTPSISIRRKKKVTLFFIIILEKIHFKKNKLNTTEEVQKLLTNDQYSSEAWEIFKSKFESCSTVRKMVKGEAFLLSQTIWNIQSMF